MVRKEVVALGNQETGKLKRRFPVSSFPRLLLMLLAAGAGWAYVAGIGGTWSVALKVTPVMCLAAIVGRRSPLICLGLAASAVGDALLDLGRFLPGVGAFMLAHALYISAFIKADRSLRPGYAAPFIVWGAIAFFAILPALGGMTLPVALYLTVICAMMWRSAAQAWPSTNHPLAWIGLLGAVLFGASDTLIALAQWRLGFSAPGIAIMALYWGGQALIAAWARFPFIHPSPRVPAPPR
ncbi:MAG TPA: lysoplasmalogenase [Armatimonadota bacterium]|jgi:uncharacterized membrane protein YhhN